MPRENKKRGRRGEEKKRKLDDVVNGDHEASKRQKVDVADESEPFADQQDYQNLENGNGAVDESYEAVEKPFFGMLDDDEQEYFKKADEMLELNSFGDPEERNLFLANVYREADGKELKIACSQSCSRLMERLIRLSSPQQLKTLFQKFNGNFVPLVQHRFASHCCEKLFIQAAPIVTGELTSPPDPEAASISIGDVYVSMENLFLYTVGELEGNTGFLLTDRFASHALRVLLLVLAGEPLSASGTKSLLQSKKKENVTVNGESGINGAEKEQEKKRSVPKSFTEALEKLMADSIAGLDTNGLRALATHQLGNPTLQLLLRLELSHFGKQKAKDERSIFHTLLPDDPITSECESASFINGLVFDPIGSHLMETIIEHAPGKIFKNLYRDFFKERMASLARNEIAGYVVCKLLERLGRDELFEAHELIAPQIPSLLERNRIGVIQTLIQRCVVREVDTQAIAVHLDGAFAGGDGFDIRKLLKISSPATQQNGDGGANHTQDQGRQHHDPAKVQGSILAQTMIVVPGPLSGLIFDSLSGLPPPALVEMSHDTVLTRTLQAAMTSTNASIISRRKLVQQFYGHIGEMALDRSASRVVDAIWEGTHGLAFIRERIAEELAENEPALRNSPCGRAVWKNWKMDLYKRRRGEWVTQSKAKASNDGFQSFSEVDKNKQKLENPEGKSRLQLARERHAAGRARRQQNQQQR